MNEFSWLTTKLHKITAGEFRPNKKLCKPKNFPLFANNLNLN
ncbi:hypothetical protein GCWU000324_00678 [Kingella oralis ATCC 51147]|uniref:Uncharacterized protein n=1 Tax=Kingella oralis ATCC 51147 TaxID=629741 RepID=C4GEW9_9NEIS|nr:hypothetical protein GCWU000324_00678 [Kingella oralis ATCC 51147]